MFVTVLSINHEHRDGTASRSFPGKQCRRYMHVYIRTRSSSVGGREAEHKCRSCLKFQRKGVISNEAASCVYLPDSSLCYEPNTRLRRYVMSYIETFITHHTAHQGLRCQNSACVSLLYVLHVQPISSPLDLITPVIFREEYK